VLQYNRLGLYADSLEILNRSYPRVAPEDGEPGAPLPSADPLLAYYRGFCREKLGQSGADDYAAASRMPLLYIFPSEPDEITVLHRALAVNASDASAHFLLGTLFFSKGMVDPALDEWKLAESLNPKIPSLQASIGRVLLEVKKQPAEAAVEFQQGLQMEPGNAALYLGLNQVMQQTGKTPAQCAEMMKRFPDLANMPEPLMRALVEALNASGRNDEANAVLAHHFLPGKEGEAPFQPQK
jgi:tetratricopeptide (TPR) repeat protein